MLGNRDDDGGDDGDDGDDDDNGGGGGGVRVARQRMSDHIMVREEVRTQNHKMMRTRNVIDVSDFHDPRL